MCGYIYRPCIASTIRMCIYLVNYYKCSFLTCWLCSVYCLRSEENNGFFYSLIVEKVRFFSADVLLATSWSSHHEFRKEKDRLLCSARRPPFRPHYSFRKQTRREGERALSPTLSHGHIEEGEKLFFRLGINPPLPPEGEFAAFLRAGNSFMQPIPTGKSTSV